VDLEKAMETISARQAALTASLQQGQAETAKLLEATVQLRDRRSRAIEAHSEWKIEMSRALQDLASQMQAGFVEMAARHNQLATRHDELAARHTELADEMAARHNELAAAQKGTQTSLNTLIRTVQEILPRLPKQ
jgi:outer membrane murein-binding lipoprotein Lpp